MSKKKKILLIDDEKDFTDIMKFTLEKNGKFEVMAENKGLNGLASAKEFKPDLILLDILMPDKDGSEVALELSEDTSTRNIPIIFLTGVIDKSEVKKRGGTVGGHPFITKESSVDEIISFIEKHMSRKRYV